MGTRRAFLRKAGLSAVGTVAGITLLPSPPDATDPTGTVEAAEPPSAVAEWTDEPITDEDDAPIGRYHYEPTGRRVPRDRSVQRRRAPRSRRRSRPRDRHVRPRGRRVDTQPRRIHAFAWDRQTESYVRQQATAAQGLLRRQRSPPPRPVLVVRRRRLDASPRGFRRSADTRSPLLPPGGRHDRSDLRRSRLAGLPDAIDLANAKEPDHDGVATVIAEDP